MGAKTFGIAVAPAVVDLQISTDRPAQFLQALRKRRGATLHLGVVGTRIREYADAPHAFLRPHRERPRSVRCRRAAKERDELAPSHVEHGAPQTSLVQLSAKPAGNVLGQD